jgi:hypothetical protein
MPLRGFEPTIPAGDRPQTHTLDRAATEVGDRNTYLIEVMISRFCSHVTTKETMQ